MIASLALRQVMRHWRTSLGALIGAAAGVAAIVFMSAVMRGLNTAAITHVVDMHTGAIVVAREGFLKAGIEDLSRDIDEGVLAKVRAVEGVAAATARLHFDGLLSNGRESANVRIVAIASTESRVCTKRAHMELDGPLVDPEDVLVGRDLGARLGLRAGDTAIVTALSANGRQNALDVQMRGRTDSPLSFANKRQLTMPLLTAQKLLGMPGRVSEIAVATHERYEVVAARLRDALGKDFLVETWAEHAPRAQRFVATTELMAMVLSFALSFLVLGFVTNATRAAVEERRREIGTMLALGVRRRQILGLFLGEAATIATVAALLGAVLGHVICLLMAQKGFEMRAPAAQAISIFPESRARDFFFASALTIGGAVVAAFLPAREASRLSPREALRED